MSDDTKEKPNVDTSQTKSEGTKPMQPRGRAPKVKSGPRSQKVAPPVDAGTVAPINEAKPPGDGQPTKETVQAPSDAPQAETREAPAEGDGETKPTPKTRGGPRERKGETILCECGKTISKLGKSTHIKKTEHKRRLEKLAQMARDREADVKDREAKKRAEILGTIADLDRMGLSTDTKKIVIQQLLSSGGV